MYARYNDVLAAMSELKTGKAVGPDGIPAEAFVYGGHPLIVLCCFFQYVSFYCYLAYCMFAFTSSVIVAIIIVYYCLRTKLAMQLSDISIYRAIAVVNAYSNCWNLYNVQIYCYN